MIRYRLSWLLLLGILLPEVCHAQGVQYTRKEAGDGGTAVPYPLVTVCTSGAAYIPLPCTPKASIYSDAALTVPLANPFRGDMFGNIEFYATPAAYIVSVTAPYSPGYSFKMNGAGGFAGTIQDTQVAVGTAANTIGNDGNLIWAPSEEDPPRKKLTVQGGLGVLRPYNYTNALNSTWSIDFAGHQANAATATFGAIQQKVISNTNGAVTGQFDFFVENAGTPADVLTLTNTGVTSPKINGILQVGIGPGQYASLQAAHDALPSTGGTVFVTATGTPFGAAGTTTLAKTKPMHIILDDATFTYTGTGQAILCTSVNAPIIEGSGFQGGGSAGGTIISITNTAANGFDINTCPGAIIRNLNIVGPGSGTGKGLIYTGNSGHIENVVVKSFGGNGCEEDGTRGNSNGVRWSGARCISNGGIGLNVFGANANLNKFEEVEVSSNTGLGAQIATATNIFDPLHSFSNNSGGMGVSFISGASQNKGALYSDLGTQTTDLAEAVGANNNKIGFLSGQNYTDAGTNNSSEMPRSLAPTASAATPSYSFQASNTTGFYDAGGGAVGFSSGGTAIELFSSTTHRLGSGKCIGWSSNADPTVAGNDTGACRESGAVIDFGNGTSSDTTAKLKAAGYISAGTKFTSNAGCTEGTLLGGATAGKFTVGQNTACTVIITMGNTATSPTGWTCMAYDQTAVPAVAIRQTASTATTCSLLMTVATNDVITFAAVGF